MYEQSVMPRNSIENKANRYSNYTNGWALFADNFDTFTKILKYLFFGITVFLIFAFFTDQIEEGYDFIKSLWNGFWMMIGTILWGVTISPVARVVWIFAFPTFIFVFINIPRKISCLRQIDLDMKREIPVYIKLYRKSEVFGEVALGCDELDFGFWSWWIFKDIKRAVLNIRNKLKDYQVVPNNYSTKNMLKTKKFNYTGYNTGDFQDEDITFFTTNCGGENPAISIVEDEEEKEWAFIRTAEIHDIGEMKAILDWDDKQGQSKTIAKLRRRVLELERERKLAPLDKSFEFFASLLADDSIEFSQLLKDSVKESNSNFGKLVSKGKEDRLRFNEDQLKEYNERLNKIREGPEDGILTAER